LRPGPGVGEHGYACADRKGVDGGSSHNHDAGGLKAGDRALSGMWWAEPDADEVSGMDRKGADVDLDLPGPWQRRIRDFGDFQDAGGVAGGSVGDGTCHRWSHPLSLVIYHVNLLPKRVWPKQRSSIRTGVIDGL